MAKNCGQVNIPEVDNESPCEDFVYSECIILNRKSELIRGTKGMDGNEYLTALENEVRVLKIDNKNIRKILANIITMFPEVGIGTY